MGYILYPGSQGCGERNGPVGGLALERQTDYTGRGGIAFGRTEKKVAKTLASFGKSVSLQSETLTDKPTLVTNSRTKCIVKHLGNASLV